MVSLHYIENINSTEQRNSFFSYISEKDKNQGVLLSTCNRLEYYWGNGIIPENVVTHLFSTTSGLKSNLVGDTYIQGQVKKAYQEALQNKNLNKSLHKLFQTALFVGKKVRNETKLSKGAVGYSQAILEILCKHGKLLKNKKITLIGVNNINEKIIRCFVRNGAETILIGNRTYEKAAQMAVKYKGEAFQFNKLKEILNNTDILISATSAPHLVVKSDIFPENKEMFILDLAVPYDIDPQIANFKGVTLIHLHQIEKMVNQNLNQRTHEILKGKEIVLAEVNRFMNQQTESFKYEKVNYNLISNEL